MKNNNLRSNTRLLNIYYILMCCACYFSIFKCPARVRHRLDFIGSLVHSMRVFLFQNQYIGIVWLSSSPSSLSERKAVNIDIRPKNSSCEHIVPGMLPGMLPHNLAGVFIHRVFGVASTLQTRRQNWTGVTVTVIIAITAASQQQQQRAKRQQLSASV